MTDLDVALRLKLINGLSGPAKTAAKDIENIKRAATRLNGVAGGARFAGEFGKAWTASVKLSQSLGAVQVKAGAATNSMQRMRAEATATRFKQAAGGALNLAGAYDRVAKAAKHAAQAPAIHGKGGAGPRREANGIGVAEAATLGGLASRYGGRFLAGAAVAGGVHSTVKNFADLETSMKQLAITANITDKEVWGDIERFRAVAPAVRSNARELTDSAYQMVNAGIDYRTAMAAAVPVAKTAKAAFADQGDVTQAGIAVVNNLKIRAEELQDAFDRMAFAGKEGQVELKNMAKVLPEVAASGANLGMKGLTGLTDIAAAL